MASETIASVLYRSYLSLKITREISIKLESHNYKVHHYAY